MTVIAGASIALSATAKEAGHVAQRSSGLEPEKGPDENGQSAGGGAARKPGNAAVPPRRKIWVVAPRAQLVIKGQKVMAPLEVGDHAKRVEARAFGAAARFFSASVDLMSVLARAAGHRHLREFTLEDLTTFDLDMANLTKVAYGGVG